jgi:phosphoribosylformylglycinamidine (FGAM) synthase-like enzyme
VSTPAARAAGAAGGGGPALHRALGLTDDEAGEIVRLLGRTPNHLELAMYAVMWSEHCSYKSSRLHLRRLPTEGPRVLVGPGENAGVVDAGGGVAVALRIESHNHPSAIEPYQGAATGVGGILRDIFTMGARPIALLDPLRFGPADDPRSQWVAAGVVSGISGYGNSVGVPTVGGETVFDPTYTGNPLVNVMAVGVLPADRLVLGRASGEGNLAVLLGSTTGRDGIGGVSVLASAGFGDDPEAEAAKRPNVQVGDPFEEKRLIEACLELLDAGVVVGIQDLGGAGLTCATSETAARGGVGMDVNVAAVPLRERGLAPWEVMTSESQERMLAIVTPADLERVVEVCRRWEVRATVVGRVTAGGRLRVLDGWDGPVLADVPASTLHDDAPLYDRPMAPPAGIAGGGSGVGSRAGAGPGGGSRVGSGGGAAAGAGAALLAMIADPSWVYHQYDHQLFLNTVVGPGGDAALLRLSAPGVTRGPGAAEAIALSTDGNSRWCGVDPRAGTALVVAESTLNVACAGATPVALVNCLNFGNPEHPEVMWQLSEAIDGMAEACRALAVPVVGGNVSLYNESRGVDIDPTPVVGTLGLRQSLQSRPPGAELAAGGDLWLLGPDEGLSFAGSRWEAVAGVGADADPAPAGALAPLDLQLHSRLLTLVAQLVNGFPLLGLHDVSDGGVALALAEMAVRSGVGFSVSGTGAGAGAGGLVAWFAEGPSRVAVCVDPGEAAALHDAASAAAVPCRRLGQAGGERLQIDGLLDLSLNEAVAAWKRPERRRPTPGAPPA